MEDAEREYWERQRCEARHRLKEIYSTIQRIRELSRKYERIRRHWNEKFSQADRALAEEDKVTKYKIGEKKEKKESIVETIESLSSEQKARLVEALEGAMEVEKDEHK